MNKLLYSELSNYVPYDEKESLDREVMLDFVKNIFGVNIVTVDDHYKKRQTS